MFYIVSTPIGNLDDISYRQAKTLISSDIILAEDTNSAKILLSGISARFGLKNNSLQLVSYYKDKEFEKLPQIIKCLKEDKIISLISESGTPLISDPGYLLLRTVIKEKIPFTVIPGPTAAITALTLSGFNPSITNGGFMFFGFLPKKESQKTQLLKKISQLKQILPEIIIIFYDSAIRIGETLRIIDNILPQAEIVICREMTKKFEEVIRGRSKNLLDMKIKGELTVVLK